MVTAISRWTSALEAWAIPDEVLAQSAGADPWTLDSNLFRPAKRTGTPSPGLATRRAAEVIPHGGSVLDVGCGGGAAGLALAPPAASVTGIDESSAMLELFASIATERGLAHRTVEGRWPDVRDAVATFDVVVCNHVFYNVPDLDRFAVALSDAATGRVVVELTPAHPQTRNAAVWKHFWDLDRPMGPSSADALAVVRSAGIDATLEHDTQINTQRADPSPEQQAAQVARMCCLPPDRVPEVMAFLADHPPARTPPDVIWWDV